LRETESEDPAVRTKFNVRDSDGTLIISHGRLKGGSALTASAAALRKRPCLHVDLNRTDFATAAAEARQWLAAHGIGELNVAGPRHSEDQRIYDDALGVLTLVFAEETQHAQPGPRAE
jgi:hypothetical protein